MDELQISGKRYISSRRIARDNGYHSDYIGQLIRGGKIKGQKVGRTWYVDAQSFDAYLGSEGSSSPQPDHFPQKVLPVSVPTAVVEQKVEPVKKVEEKKEEQKIEIKKVAEPVVLQPRYVPVASGGLRFVPDDEPLLPEIVSHEGIAEVMPHAAPTYAPTERDIEAVVVERRPRHLRIFFALGGVALVIFIFTVVVSSSVFEKINIEAGNSASVGYGVGW
jgi:hypothetical protein